MNRESALNRLKQQRAQAPPKHSAASSHLENDKYMDEFEKGWNELRGLQIQDKGAGSSPAPVASRPAAARPAGIRANRSADGPALSKYPAQVNGGWRKGPIDPSGVVCDLSERPNMCSAANWGRNEVVIGSSDHALYVVDATTCARKRTLYNKTNGHQEWVTCVTYCAGDKIVSGGMDSKLWLWPAAGTRGMQLEGHSAPISQVCSDPSSGLAISASYDKTVRLWDIGGARGREVSCLSGHNAPVLELDCYADGRIITGDRSGHIILWDTSSGTESWRMKNVHEGHITSLAWSEDASGPLAGCFASGGQDGYLRVWDPRSKTNPAKVQLHVNEKGKGAVSDICAGGEAARGQIVTAGADGTVRVLDPAASFSLQSTVKLTNFPYSLAVAGGLALAGCGDGSLHVIDIILGKTLYALGANQAAVRTLDAASDRLVCSGDDGKVVLYNFM